ncbi:MAG: hypothetical protein AAFR27_10340 [Pseudomonadota bacterium]
MIGRFLRLALLSMCIGGVSTSAFATSAISCIGVDADVEVFILFGAGPILTPISATVTIGDEEISTIAKAEPASIAQFKGDEKELHLDLVDAQAIDVLASVRILRFDDGASEPVQIGYVSAPGEGAFAIRCDGP